MRPETFLVLIMAGGIGGLAGLSPLLSAKHATSPLPEVVDVCRATDGDTIRCGRERIRLLGIDAPELPGHCQGNRVCAPGDPWASTASLERAMSASMAIARVGQDRYGRTLAMVAGPRGDLSCWQLRARQAIYKPAWDDGFSVARTCPGAATAR